MRRLIDWLIRWFAPYEPDFTEWDGPDVEEEYERAVARQIIRVLVRQEEEADAKFFQELGIRPMNEKVTRGSLDH